MSRIAHLSDLHVDGSADRSGRLSAALARAVQTGCTYLVITGDLTAWGDEKDFEELARVMTWWPSDRVTIVPGNHDLRESGWERTLTGTSLRRFAPTSITGTVVDLGDARIVPIDTQYHGRALAFRALGRVSHRQLGRLEEVATGDPRPLIAAMHHGPQWHLLQFFDGMTNRHQVHNMLSRHPNMHVLCGHDHRTIDLSRVHAAPSVAEYPDPLRIYDVRGHELVVVK